MNLHYLLICLANTASPALINLKFMILLNQLAHKSKFNIVNNTVYTVSCTPEMFNSIKMPLMKMTRGD